MGYKVKISQGDRWEIGYAHLKTYKEKYGNCDVPNNYTCEDGYKLWQWMNQNKYRFRNGKLSEERKARLFELEWDPRISMESTYLVRRTRKKKNRQKKKENPANTSKDRASWAWNNALKKMKSYIEENGTSKIKQGYVFNGFELGKWAAIQRSYARHGKLKKEKIEKLEEIGFKFESQRDKEHTWEYGLEQYKAYVRETGDGEIPGNCIYKGYNLSHWKMYTLEKIRHYRNSISEGSWNWLVETGFIRYHWSGKGWIEEYLKEYTQKNGNRMIPKEYVCEDGFTLGIWAWNYNKEKSEFMQRHGIHYVSSEREFEWYEKYTAIKALVIEKHIENEKQIDENDEMLGTWFRRQQRLIREYNKGKANSLKKDPWMTVVWKTIRIRQIEEIMERIKKNRPEQIAAIKIKKEQDKQIAILKKQTEQSAIEIPDELVSFEIDDLASHPFAEWHKPYKIETGIVRRQKRCEKYIERIIDIAIIETKKEKEAQLEKSVARRASNILCRTINPNTIKKTEEILKKIASLSDRQIKKLRNAGETTYPILMKAREIAIRVLERKGAEFNFSQEESAENICVCYLGDPNV